MKDAGWRVIFDALEVANRDSEGFRCLQLIVTTYIGKMSLACLEQCLSVVAIYAQGKGDLN